MVEADGALWGFWLGKSPWTALFRLGASPIEPAPTSTLPMISHHSATRPSFYRPFVDSTVRPSAVSMQLLKSGQPNAVQSVAECEEGRCSQPGPLFWSPPEATHAFT
jgi:hypothetical protein